MGLAWCGFVVCWACPQAWNTIPAGLPAVGNGGEARAARQQPPSVPLPHPQGTYNALRKLVETKWAAGGAAKKPVVAWVTTNSSGVSFRLDPYKMTLIKVGWVTPGDAGWRRVRAKGGMGGVCMLLTFASAQSGAAVVAWLLARVRRVATRAHRLAPPPPFCAGRRRPAAAARPAGGSGHLWQQRAVRDAVHFCAAGQHRRYRHPPQGRGCVGAARLRVRAGPGVAVGACCGGRRQFATRQPGRRSMVSPPHPRQGRGCVLLADPCAWLICRHPEGRLAGLLARALPPNAHAHGRTILLSH